jgi:hypothetical protein
MTYGPDKIVVWEGPDGILVHGQEYRVFQAREGNRTQEFTLKRFDGIPVDGSVWWEAGSPFRYPRQEAL